MIDSSTEAFARCGEGQGCRAQLCHGQVLVVAVAASIAMGCGETTAGSPDDLGPGTAGAASEPGAVGRCLAELPDDEQSDGTLAQLDIEGGRPAREVTWGGDGAAWLAAGELGSGSVLARYEAGCWRIVLERGEGTLRALAPAPQGAWVGGTAGLFRCQNDGCEELDTRLDVEHLESWGPRLFESGSVDDGSALTTFALHARGGGEANVSIDLTAPAQLGVGSMGALWVLSAQELFALEQDELTAASAQPPDECAFPLFAATTGDIWVGTCRLSAEGVWRDEGMAPLAQTADGGVFGRDAAGQLHRLGLSGWEAIPDVRLPADESFVSAAGEFMPTWLVSADGQLLHLKDPEDPSNSDLQ